MELAPELTSYPQSGMRAVSFPRASERMTQRVQAYYSTSKRWVSAVAASGLGQSTRRLFMQAHRAFTLHPAQTQESYLQHLWFTVKTSLRFISVSILLLTHGVCPFLFTRTASIQIEQLYLMMRSRIPKTRRETIEIEYDI